jgi:hypothetical protein
LPLTSHWLSSTVTRYAPLQRNGSTGSDLLISNSDREAHLTSHGSSTDDRFVQLQSFHERGNASNVAVLGVGMRAWRVVLGREASTMSWKVEAVHIALLAHTSIIHDAMILASIGAGCVQEDNVLIAIARLLVENLTILVSKSSIAGELPPCIVPKLELR